MNKIPSVAKASSGGSDLTTGAGRNQATPSANNSAPNLKTAHSVKNGPVRGNKSPIYKGQQHVEHGASIPSIVKKTSNPT